MASRKVEIGLALAIVAIVVVMVVRALGGSEDSKAVAVSDVRQALHELPYSYRFREVGPSDGAERVVAGTAYGPGGAVVHFGAAFGGSPDPVPLPGEGAEGTLELGEGVITTREGKARDRGGRSGNSKGKPAEQPSDPAQMAAQILTKLCQTAGETSCPEGGGDEEDGGGAPSSGQSESVFRRIDQGSLPE
jgi:hypothetical protein